MSVSKPKGGVTFRYDFRYQGHRFVGNTGKSTKGEARKVERQKRLEAPAELAKINAEKAQAALDAKCMAFDVAAGKYWDEVGQHHADADGTLSSLAWLLKHVGPKTPLIAIDDAFVARLVAIRRGQTVIRRGKTKTPPRLVLPATVNRTCTEPLRKVLTRARKMWKQPLQDIDWNAHLLEEPQEIVNELKQDQENLIEAEARDDYLALHRFSLASGLRDAECLLPLLSWSCFDWGNRVIKTAGKGGKVRLLPITAEIREIVWPLQGRHPEAVFCYQVTKTRRGTDLVEGQWRPITQSGRKSWWRRFRKRIGLTGYRWHDNRHTTGTRLLRETGNLKMVQQLLGHSDIATTTKYAHVLLEDLREGMEAVSSHKKSHKSQDDGRINKTAKEL